MSSRTHHSIQEIHHGHPAWVDLSTHDLPAAETFYSELFGWRFVDQGGDFGGYRMIFKDDREIAGAMSSLSGPEGPTEEPQGPTTWIIYLRTNDIDATVDTVVEAGGSVLVDPLTVGDSGRMAIVADPAGAVLGLWEPDQFPGFSKAALTGMPVWFELSTRDFDAVLPFYEKVAGWKLTYVDEHGKPVTGATRPGFRYALNGTEETATAGVYDAGADLAEEDPGSWEVYLDVSDVDGAVGKVRELGGTLLEGPVNSPFGRWATIADPQGASFRIIAF